MLRWLALASIAVITIVLVVGLMLPNIISPGGSQQRKVLSLEEKATGPGQHLVAFDLEHYWLPTQRDYHLNDGTPYTGYDSTPPAYGPHWPITAKWGIHEDPVPNERQLHNLEHGGVTIQYTTQDPEIAKNIIELSQSLRAFPSCILVAPYPTMEHPIALTAWGVLLTLDKFDRKAIVDFVDFYRDQGPERTACAEMGGP